MQEARAQRSETVHVGWLDDAARGTLEDLDAVRNRVDATQVNAYDREDVVLATLPIKASCIILSSAATKPNAKDQHWRRKERASRLLELLLAPQRKALLENIDPCCWRMSCKLVVEDFQDATPLSNNLLSCHPVCNDGALWAGVWRGVLRLSLATVRRATSSVPNLWVAAQRRCRPAQPFSWISRPSPSSHF